MPTPLPAGVTHLWTVHLDTPATGHSLDVLSREEQWRAGRFRAERDRRRYVVAHVMLRNILARYTDTPAASLRLTRNEWGKPLLDAPNAPGFNLTHSGDLALVAITQRTDVGVDVEQMSPAFDCLDLARAYFSPSERAELSALPPHEREEGFYRCWTRKEAIIKATGRGIATPLDSFDVPVSADDAPISISINGKSTIWSVRTFVPAHGYIAAVALYGAVGSLHHMGGI